MAYPVDTIGNEPMETLEKEEHSKHDDERGIELIPEDGEGQQ